MNAITAVNTATLIAKRVSANLKTEIRERIPAKVYTVDFWTDQIPPECYFASNQDLLGFVYIILVNINPDEN